jgi:hypothetical protein
MNLGDASPALGNPNLRSLTLAHPIRVAQTIGSDLEDLLRLFSPREADARRMLLDTAVPLEEVMEFFVATASFAKQAVALSAHDASVTGLGHFYAQFAWFRHRLTHAPHFVIEDELAELLDHSDIATDIPMAHLRLPYPSMYLELGTARTLTQCLHNEATGIHTLEGAYLNEATIGSARSLNVTFTASPLGHQGPLDDATFCVSVLDRNDGSSLTQMLDEATDAIQESSPDVPLRPATPEGVADAKTCMVLVAKALLYLSLADTRREVHDGATKLRAALARTKSGSKRAKLERKLERTYDYVLVRPQERHLEELAQAGSTAGQTLEEGHWRRGHFRMQPYGPRHSLRQIRWIARTWVGPAAEDSPKSYIVR